MLRIKRDDKVMVITGKDKGKTGKVIKVFLADQKVVVENINLMKKSVKKSDQYPNGGFIEVERPVHISNVMLVDSKSVKPTRYLTKVLKDGGKVRVAKKSGETI
ncbi:MAG: 50S ribosomal protein L24 [Candidatus Omnitrophica bacterium]|nr:50S ribosomal protein L24 [Candidatus Omnitrophota bacterium]